jgi:hypothetical protein
MSVAPGQCLTGAGLQAGQVRRVAAPSAHAIDAPKRAGLDD